MQMRSVVEVLSAAHLSYLVTSPAEFSGRGGLHFVAPTGQLKTAITKTLDFWKPHAVVTGDLTLRQLGEMREEIATGKVRTLAFMELQKVHARNRDVAMNVEAALQMMADEGFRTPHWLPQDMTLREARALIVAAMPTSFYKKKWGEWKLTGYARRFLWCHFQLANSEAIMDSIDRWEPLDFGKQIYAFPAANSIPFSCTEVESEFIRGILRETQAGYEAVPFILLKKILCVLKWRYDEIGKSAPGKSIEILADFSECLKGVAELQIDTGGLKIEDKKPAHSMRRAKGR